jgi:hypothetical protein
MHRGVTQRQTCSPFLIELPAREVDWIDADDGNGGESRSQDDDEELSTLEAAGRWYEGMLVRHPTFGLGRLMWVQPAGRNTRAGVRFTTGEQKTLILEYAKLVAVDVHEVD